LTTNKFFETYNIATVQVGLQWFIMHKLNGLVVANVLGCTE